MKNFSIKTKLVYTHIFMAMGSILLVGLLSIVISLRIFHNREEEYLNRIAREVEMDLARFFEEEIRQESLEDFLSLMGFQNNVALRLLTPEGLLYSQSRYLSSDEGDTDFAAPDNAFPLMPVVRRRLAISSLRTYTLEVLRYDEYLFHPVSLLVEGMLLASLMAIAIAILVGRFSGKRVARPIINLAHLAEELKFMHWDTPLPQSNAYELDVLAGSLDQMRNQLSASFHELREERDVLKRFLQDASHQLRTPVTALNTFLELMISDAPGVGERREELLRDGLSQVQKLSWIITDLLDLTRLESGHQTPCREIIVLKDLCRKAWTGLEKEAEKKALFLDLAGSACEIRGDAHRIEMALSNVLENAVKWSPAGSRIDVRLIQEKEQCHIRIRDRGPGIAEEDLSRIFERFFRSPRAEQEGTGLGLAIVERIMTNCGGVALAGNSPKGGALFELIFPAARAGGNQS